MHITILKNFFANFFAAGPSQGKKRPLGGMSPDAGQSLRTGPGLTNPSGMQAARWTASKRSLRSVGALTS